MSKPDNKLYGEKKSTYHRLTSAYGKKKSKRKKGKDYARSTLEKYVKANIKSAMGKLKRAKAKGYYKASPELQEINSQLRSLYRKFDKDVNNLYKSKSFVESLKSNADLAVLYRAVRDIKELNMRDLSKKYSKLKDKLADRGVDLVTTFDMLSMLSSDFHEIFAFLSYNRVSSILESGTVLDVFEEFLAESQDKYLNLNDLQSLYAQRGLDKIQSKLDAKNMDYLKIKLKMKGIII